MSTAPVLGRGVVVGEDNRLFVDSARGHVPVREREDLLQTEGVFQPTNC
jgi:hypothetical protein